MILRSVDAVMAEQRAASFKTRSIKASAKLAGLRLALSMIDLTTLEGKDSPEKVRGLCQKAVRPDPTRADLPSVAAVCVYPTMIKVACDNLATIGGSHVKVAAVATGFPSGQFPLAVRIADTEQAVRDGADEIDMVISRGAFLSGRYDEVAEEIREFKNVCNASGSLGGKPHVHLKVILETGELETYDNARRASDLAIEALLADGGEGPAGTGFIKTSTGKVVPAATMPVTLVMLEAIRDCYLATGKMIGMKPAGGIRTAKESLHYLVMLKETLGDKWLNPDWFRFGASTLANDVLRQIAWLETGKYAARYDFSES
ncbi:MAG TPA: deoxyribose-phosphate aldolase [Phycisphaerales bacterium]|nr:deoxyribose-phosphate aldolase [Phycisphaerales bacterium]